MLETVIERRRDSEIAARGALRMLIAARWLERIGDHAANVGERTIYRLTGERPADGRAGVRPPVSGSAAAYAARLVLARPRRAARPRSGSPTP